MKDNFNLFPRKRILPYDGMSITASVWDEAHAYHAQTQNAHLVFMHGAGIVRGLEVIASDPADHIVYLLPGVAIDPVGNIIILAEPVAYDFGEKMSGRLHLYLLHREVKTLEKKTEENNLPAYTQDEYVIVARTDEITTPCVEIARINRTSPQAPITDAADPLAPQPDAIDLRYRVAVCPPPAEQVLAGVIYLGEGAEAGYTRALSRVSAPLAQETRYRLIIDNPVLLNKEIYQYQLIYLVANPKSHLSKIQADTLQTYLQSGGKAFIEFSEPMDDGAVAEYFKPLNLPLEKVTPEHLVYQNPHLFITPPQGGLPVSAPDLWQAGTGILCTNAGYGLLWSGQTRQPGFTREVIRSAEEWGVNLFSYLLGNEA